MKKFAYYSILLSIICISFSSLSAQALRENEEPAGRGLVLGAHISYAGWGLGADFIIENPKKNFDWLGSIELYSVKNNRENLITSSFGDRGTNYIYGKLSYLFMLTPTAGIQKNIISHENGSLLGLDLSIKAGPAFAMLTPYYLEIFEPLPGTPYLGESVTRPYDPEIHSYSNIIGRGGIFGGPFDVSPKVGATLRVQALLDFARAYKFVSGMQLSVNVEYFPENVPIMAAQLDHTNKNLFINLALGLIVGNKW